MKPRALSLAALALTFFVSCASSDGFADPEAKQCGAGSDVDIDAGFDPAGSPQSDRVDSRLTFMVEVSNNSSQDITVTTVRVDFGPGSRDDGYQIQGATRSFERVIAQGESSMFEIPLTGGYPAGQFGNPAMRDRGVTGRDASVTVRLSNGGSYHCRFRVPVPV